MTVEACKYRMALHFRNTELSKDLFFICHVFSERLWAFNMWQACEDNNKSQSFKEDRIE